MSSPSSQFGSSSPFNATPSSEPNSTTTQTNKGGLSHTSIALICAFLVCFTFFVYLSSRPPRVSQAVRASSSRPRRSTPKRPKPKLCDVWLDEDPRHELELSDKAVCNWRPLAAWTKGDPTSDDLRQNPPHPEMVMVPHAGIAQAWFRGAYSFDPRAKRSAPSQSSAPPTPPEPPPVSDPRMLNVAVLVALPSRRKFAPQVSETVPHPAIGSGLAYGEGQLVLGVTSLPCEEQAIRAALGQQERTT